MIIEFVGIPGSGKSSAAQHLLQVAQECGLDAIELPLSPVTARSGTRGARRLRKAWLVVQRAGFLLRRPRMLSAIFQGLARSRRSWEEARFAFRHVSVTAHALGLARTTTPSERLIVAHEGILQRLFTVFVDGHAVADPKLVKRFLRGSPLPDAIILLRVSPRIALARVRERGHGPLSYRFEGLTDHALEQQFGAGQQLLLDAMQHPRIRTSSIRTHVLDADELPLALETLSEHFLRTLLDEGRER